MLFHDNVSFFLNRNSYGYQIQEPSEPKVDDTKYKYDYTLQQPTDEKVAETPKRTMDAKVDRMTQDKPGKMGFLFACKNSSIQSN